eukprot:Gb_01143 [translate_table: standard]
MLCCYQSQMWERWSSMHTLKNAEESASCLQFLCFLLHIFNFPWRLQEQSKDFVQPAMWWLEKFEFVTTDHPGTPGHVMTSMRQTWAFLRSPQSVHVVLQQPGKTKVIWEVLNSKHNSLMVWCRVPQSSRLFQVLKVLFA